MSASCCVLSVKPATTTASTCFVRLPVKKPNKVPKTARKLHKIAAQIPNQLGKPATANNIPRKTPKNPNKNDDTAVTSMDVL